MKLCDRNSLAKTITLALMLLGGALSSMQAQAAGVEDLLGQWHAVSEDAVVQRVSIEEPVESFPGFESIKRAQFVAEGDCLHCAAPSIVVVRDFGDNFVPSLQVGDKAEYITVEAVDASTLKLVVEVYQEPAECRPPFDCQWEVVRRTPLLFTKALR